MRYRQHQRRVAVLDDEPVVPVVGLLDRHRSVLVASIHQPRGAGAASFNASVSRSGFSSQASVCRASGIGAPSSVVSVAASHTKHARSSASERGSPSRSAADRRARLASSHHDVQIPRRSAQELAVGRRIAGKGVQLLIARAHDDARLSGGRETHAVALEHRKPAIDTGKRRERPGLLDVGDADAQGPARRIGPGKKRPRPAAAVGPALGLDLRRVRHPHRMIRRRRSSGRTSFDVAFEPAVVGTPVR